jgi:diguanylate cyclase (GGDEF)-like protein/PAS domain S-box-containing protein
MGSRSPSSTTGPLARPGFSRGAFLSIAGLALILYSVLIYGGVLTGTAAYWCSDIFWTLFSLLAGIRCLVTARRQPLPHHRRAWTFFGLAALSWFIGMLLWDYQELILGSYAPYPSVADYFFNGFAPLFIAGIFYYRSEQPTADFTLKQAGTLGMIFSALVVVFTIVFLGPITAAGKSLEFLVLSIVHAVLPMTALLFGLTVLWLYVWGGLRLIYVLLVFSIALHAGTDILYNYAQLGESFGASNYLNIYWLIAFTLQYWAAQEQAALSETGDMAVRDERPERPVHELEALIPALLIAGMVVVAWLFRVELTYRTVSAVLPVVLIFGIFLGSREWWLDHCETRLTEALRLSNEALGQANFELKRDMDVRERAEEALRESEERYRNVVEDMPALICRFFSDGTLTFVNEQYCRYFNRACEQLVGSNFFQFIPEEDQDGVRKHFASLTPENAAVSYEHKVVAPDGSERWQRWTDRALFDEHGHVVEYQSIGEDITDGKRKDDALRESERRFRSLIEGSVQGIYIHRSFKPLFVNQAFANILGYESVDMLLASMKSIEEHHAPHERERIRAYKEARIRGDEAPVRYEYEALRKDGSKLILQNAVRVINWDGEPAIQSTVIDVTEARELSEQLSYQASHDALTDLLNRRAFEQRLQQLLETAKAENVEHALCYLDLDQFKVINDTCGHIAGDELLRQFGYLLKQHIRGRDTLARLGGDEFGILLERCSVREAKRVTAAVQKAVDRFRFQWEDKSFSVGASIGVVPINESSENMEGVLSMADAACYAAKDSGFNRMHIYQADDVALAKRRGEMQWVTVINRALEEGRFQPYFQSFVPLSSGDDHSEGYELLLRMREEDGCIIAPGAFLPAAERYNLATKLDRWVVGTAFEWFSRHRDKLEQALMCSINLSGNSLGDSDFLQYVIGQLEEKNLPPKKICFEVTETAAISNLTNATNFIKALKKRGCRFALDDFGSGLSSFAYLKNLPVYFLKIDGMFVKDILDDPVHLAMVKSINDMGHVMGKQTIAEFVENDAILDKLKEVGVDYAQGYGIALPRPLDELITPPRVESVKTPARRVKQAVAGGRKA